MQGQECAPKLKGPYSHITLSRTYVILGLQTLVRTKVFHNQSNMRLLKHYNCRTLNSEQMNWSPTNVISIITGMLRRMQKGAHHHLLGAPPYISARQEA